MLLLKAAYRPTRGSLCDVSHRRFFCVFVTGIAQGYCTSDLQGISLESFLFLSFLVLSSSLSLPFCQFHRHLPTIQMLGCLCVFVTCWAQGYCKSDLQGIVVEHPISLSLISFPLSLSLYCSLPPPTTISPPCSLYPSACGSHRLAVM